MPNLEHYCLLPERNLIVFGLYWLEGPAHWSAFFFKFIL